MRNLFLSIFLVMVMVTLYSQEAYAQADFNVNRIQEILSITTLPQIPKASEKVSISIDSSAYDLNAASIIWFVNNKQITGGRGITTFTFTNGALGTKTHVAAVITPLTGGAFRKDLYFSPVDVALIWEAKTYTPPFYAGKALMTNQALLSVIATPEFVTSDGRRLDPDTLTYTWKRNGVAMGSVSGYGKRTFTYFGSVLSPTQKISVLVTNKDASVQGQGTVDIPTTNPVVMFYENNPLYGVLSNKTIDTSLQMTDKEVSLSAVPFFFSRKTSSKDILDFNWTLNGVVAGDKTKDTITLRNDAGNSGTSILGVTVLNEGNTFQNAQKNLSLMYGN